MKQRFIFLLVLAISSLTIGLVSAQDGVTISILGRGDTWDPENYYVPVIEEAIGATLDYRMVPSSQYVEVRNVTMASGDLPDALRVAPTEAVYSEYIEAGLLLPLNDLLDAHPAIKDAFSADVWEASRYSDGNIYLIPRISGVFPHTIAYRTDWTEALGIEQPTTTEEFKAMLQAFVDEDPGGLGSAMIPFVPNRLSGDGAMVWLDPIMSPFGVNYMTWVPSADDPDQIILSHTKESFKDAVLYARDLYDSGLLDQTWGVSTERGLFKFYAGIAGSTSDWPQFSHLRLEAIEAAFPGEGASIGYISGLIGPDGTQGGPAVTPFAQDMGVAITTSATPEEAEAYMRMIEWQYTDGYELMTLGVEGITFDIGEDGIARRRGRDAILEENPAYDLYMLDRVFHAEPPYYFDYSRQNPSWNDVSDEMFDYVTTVLDEVGGIRILNYGVNTNSEVINDNMLAIRSVVDEFITKAILTPEFDVDAEFDAFLVKLEDNNLSGVTAAINELNSVADINALVGE